jgi:hypothetical protein
MLRKLEDGEEIQVCPSVGCLGDGGGELYRKAVREEGEIWSAREELHEGKESVKGTWQ